MRMKFLTDENIALSLVKALRAAGFEVKDIKEEKLQGVADKEIFKIALKEQRVILTHDKDFGVLLAQKKEDIPGVILLRFRNQNPKLIAPTLLGMLQSNLHEKFLGNMVTISEDKIIIRKGK